MNKYSCVYCITTSGSNKIYIGSAVNFDARVATHISHLNSHTHCNNHLQAAWDKYGAESFTFSCIEECPKESLLEREQFWIDYYNAANPDYGYNIVCQAGNTTGFRHSNQTKDVLRQKAFGRVLSDETKQKMSIAQSGEGNGMFGKHHTPESRRKMMLMSDGRSRSERYSGSGNPFFGKQHSELTKQTISHNRKGKRAKTKLTECDVVKIKNMIRARPNNIYIKDWLNNIAAEFSVSTSCIRKIYNGERWADIK